MGERIIYFKPEQESIIEWQVFTKNPDIQDDVTLKENNFLKDSMKYELKQNDISGFTIDKGAHIICNINTGFSDLGIFCKIKTSEIKIQTKHGLYNIPIKIIRKINITRKFFGLIKVNIFTNKGSIYEGYIY